MILSEAVEAVHPAQALPGHGISWRGGPPPRLCPGIGDRDMHRVEPAPVRRFLEGRPHHHLLVLRSTTR
jgi:hypothetical protein